MIHFSSSTEISPKHYLTKSQLKKKFIFLLWRKPVPLPTEKYQDKRLQCAFVSLDWTRSYFHPIILSFTICLKLCRLWKASRCWDCFSFSFHMEYSVCHSSVIWTTPEWHICENTLPTDSSFSHFFFFFSFSLASTPSGSLCRDSPICRPAIHQGLLQTWIIFV